MSIFSMQLEVEVIVVTIEPHFWAEIRIAPAGVFGGGSRVRPTRDEIRPRAEELGGLLSDEHSRFVAELVLRDIDSETIFLIFENGLNVEDAFCLSLFEHVAVHRLNGEDAAVAIAERRTGGIGDVGGSLPGWSGRRIVLLRW